jgi:hypothetical protein
MTKNKKILKLLYRSFDDRLKEKEQKKLEQALEHSPGLQQEKKQIEVQRMILANTAIQSFKPFFVERMMAQVNALGGKTNGLDLQMFYESLVSVFRRFVVAGAVISVLLFIYSQGIGDILPLEEALTLSDLTLHEILAMF